MYEIEFYESKNGYSEIVEYIKELKCRSTTNKESRINFNNAYYNEQRFLILHHFIKKTRKTPRRELERALKKLKDYKERNN